MIVMLLLQHFSDQMEIQYLNSIHFQTKMSKDL